MKVQSARLFIVLLVLAVTTAVYANADPVITGKVVGVSDGDTIIVLKDRTQIKIRFYGIDSPEKSQAFGNKAKQFTSNLVFGKTVALKPMDTDRYGRTVSWVFVDGKNVNEEIVKAGFAWHYKKYSSDANLSQAEIAARRGKLGLWSDPNAIPPWEFRQLRKIPKSQTSPQTGYHGNINSRYFISPDVSITIARTARLCLVQKVRRKGLGIGRAEDANREPSFKTDKK